MHPYVEYFRSLGWDSALALADVAPKTREKRDHSRVVLTEMRLRSPEPDDMTKCAPMQRAI